MSATRTTQMRHDCYTNGTSVAQVKIFNFDKYTSENIFSHSYISYIANEKLQEEEQFHSKNCLLEISRMKTRYV